MVPRVKGKPELLERLFRINKVLDGISEHDPASAENLGRDSNRVRESQVVTRWRIRDPEDG